MKWDAIGAVGEVASAIAVVLTLGYLARQVHFAREAASDSNRLNRANGVKDMVIAVATDAELMKSVSKAHGLAPFHEAYAQQFETTPDEAARADWFHVYYFWVHWGQFSSSTTRKDLSEIANIVTNFYQMPPIRYSWDHSPWANPLLDPEFVEFGENTLAIASKKASTLS